MSIETDFRAALLAHAPLVSLVPAERITVNAAESGIGDPYIAFQAAKDPQFGLGGEVQVEHATLTVQCWSRLSSTAAAVGDLVKAAIDAWAATSPLCQVAVIEEQDTFDGELGLDGRVLTVDWWQQ